MWCIVHQWYLCAEAEQMGCWDELAQTQQMFHFELLTSFSGWTKLDQADPAERRRSDQEVGLWAAFYRLRRWWQTLLAALVSKTSAPPYCRHSSFCMSLPVLYWKNSEDGKKKKSAPTVYCKSIKYRLWIIVFNFTSYRWDLLRLRLWIFVWPSCAPLIFWIVKQSLDNLLLTKPSEKKIVTE